ncbi:hypothetical protein ACGFT2_26810 [Streptomyces sp. NPDC048514]|uniref:hypothetical protein n=1 Tax=Streptomyces sp. NPDC048514 TaxID=3365564 RepID=UPI0037145368
MSTRLSVLRALQSPLADEATLLATAVAPTLAGLRQPLDAARVTLSPMESQCICGLN